ncbi:MAG: NnrU family protein [Burkholderiaceae bacterium]|nr:NnrU family protein [Burkholderiaceae bacterium]
MGWLILGLVLFFGPHSVRIFADDWRSAMIGRIGVPAWKGIYTLVSIIGLVLIVHGYGIARADPTLLWTPPAWGRHATALLSLVAFVLVAAAYVPGTHIRERLGHPMLAGVKAWALGHLLSNGTLADLILFGVFLVWAIAHFAVSRRRDRTEGRVRPAAGWSRDAIAIVAGIVATGVFAMWLHVPLIGVRPF